jgi:hypothetical protein
MNAQEILDLQKELKEAFEKVNHIKGVHIEAQVHEVPITDLLKIAHDLNLETNTIDHKANGLYSTSRLGESHKGVSINMYSEYFNIPVQA